MRERDEKNFAGESRKCGPFPEPEHTCGRDRCLEMQSEARKEYSDGNPGEDVGSHSLG